MGLMGSDLQDQETFKRPYGVERWLYSTYDKNAIGAVVLAFEANSYKTAFFHRDTPA